MKFEGQPSTIETEALQSELYWTVGDEMQKALIAEALFEGEKNENKNDVIQKWIDDNSVPFRLAFNSLYHESNTFVYEWQDLGQREELLNKIKNRMNHVRQFPDQYKQFDPKTYDFENKQTVQRAA